MGLQAQSEVGTITVSVCDETGEPLNFTKVR